MPVRSISPKLTSAATSTASGGGGILPPDARQVAEPVNEPDLLRRRGDSVQRLEQVVMGIDESGQHQAARDVDDRVTLSFL